MLKMRAHWPSSFDQAHANAIKAMRECVVEESNPSIVDCYCAKMIREANHMPGQVCVNIIEDEEVTRIALAWQEWLGLAR